MSTDLFQHIAQPKKRAIMQAALAEFSARGFEAASTRAIAAQAGVAHGLLFYYFKDKETLLIQLMECCLSQLGGQLLDGIDTEQDYISRMYSMMRLKLELYAQCPEIYHLFLDAYFEQDSSLGIRMERMRQRFSAQLIPLMLSPADNDRFRDDIDAELAKKMVNSALAGMSDTYLKSYMQGHLSMNQLMQQGIEEGKRYVELMGKVLYKD